MASFIAKQPNGKYCRFSVVTDCPTHINMTFEDYIEVVMKKQKLDRAVAKREAEDVFSNYLQPFDEVIRRFLPENMSLSQFLDIIKKTVVDDGLYEEIIFDGGNRYEDEDELNTVLNELEGEVRKIVSGHRK